MTLTDLCSQLQTQQQVAGSAWFDGLGSALIGAAATIGAVLLVMRHERQMRRQDAIDRLVADAVSAFSDAAMIMTIDGLRTDRAKEANRLMLQAHSHLMTGIARSEPEFRTLLWDGAQDLTAATQLLAADDPEAEQAYKDAVMRIRVSLGRWTMDPDGIRFGAVDYATVREIISTVDDTGHVQRPFPIGRPTWRDRLGRRMRVLRHADGQ